MVCETRWELVLRDRKGGLIRNIDYKSPPNFGKDVRLTIDLNLQFIAYGGLSQRLKVIELGRGPWLRWMQDLVTYWLC